MENSSKLERFNNTLNDFENELKDLKSTSKAYKRLEDLVRSYEGISKDLEKNGKAMQALVIQYVKKHEAIEKAIVEITNSNATNFEKLRSENKNFYFDFEKTLKIKLEENKSEIKRLIEEERLKVKEIITSELDKRTEIILNSQKGLKKTVLIMGIIILLVSIAGIVILIVK